MRADEFDLTMDDGVAVHVRRWLPDAEPRAVVQVTHGMAEHAGRYARLAGILVEAGYAVWAHDHRGHGGTARRDDDLGHFADEAGFDRVVADLLAVRAELGREGQAGRGLPVALFAHSMGTFISQAALALHPPVAVGRGRPRRIRRPRRPDLPGVPAGGPGRAPAPGRHVAAATSWTPWPSGPTTPRSGPPGPTPTGSRAMRPRSTCSSPTRAPASR